MAAHRRLVNKNMHCMYLDVSPVKNPLMPTTALLAHKTNVNFTHDD